MNSVPIGTIISFMGVTAPDEYLICDGTIYNIDEYKELADFFKEEFGSYNNFGGNGTTTFAVPDLRGEFLRGTGTNSHTNQGSGASVGVHQNATRHQYMEIDTNAMAGMVSTGGGGVYNADYMERATSTWRINVGSTIQLTHNTYYTSRPTNTSILYCIKYKS